MDVRTLSMATGLVSLSLAILSVVMAAFRRRRSATAYAIGYAAGALGYCLLMTQEVLSPWISVLAANILIIFYQSCLAWGLRTKTECRRAWPLRFALWLAAIAAALILGRDSYTVRAIAMSLLSLVFSVEFIIAAEGGLVPLRGPFRAFSWAVSLGFIAFHAVRIGIVAAEHSPGGYFVDHGGSGSFTLLFILPYQVLWAGLVMAIDISSVLRELERRNRILNEMAVTDQLTGLFNRHLLEANVAADMERARRYGEPLSLILLDLDHFKEVNDRFGHQAGDEVLRHVSSIIRSAIRKAEVVYRWGGEEFLILAPNTAMGGALVLAEKVRRTIEQSRFPAVGSLTASLGVAEWGWGCDRESWFRRVDQALYRAKNWGRNRVEAIGPLDDRSGGAFRIEWQQAWSSGNERIDAQHRELVEACNALLDRFTAEAPSKELVGLLDGLMEACGRHFSDEEEILAAAGYPKAAAHAAIHRDLRSSAEKIRARASTGVAEPAQTYFDFLVNAVVMRHMIHDDADYFPWIKGISGAPKPGFASSGEEDAEGS